MGYRVVRDTPILQQFRTDWHESIHLDGCWYIVKHISHDSDLYLRKDGTWQRGMDPHSKNGGGTYFKTLEEVIEVVVKFEINVVGPDYEED